MKVKIKTKRGEWFRYWYSGTTPRSEEAWVFDTEDELFSRYFEDLFDENEDRLVYVWPEEKEMDLTELVRDYDPEPQFNAGIEGDYLTEGLKETTGEINLCFVKV